MTTSLCYDYYMTCILHMTRTTWLRGVEDDYDFFPLRSISLGRNCQAHTRPKPDSPQSQVQHGTRGFGQFGHRRSFLTSMINWNWHLSTLRTSHIFDIFDRFRLFGMEHWEESGRNYVRWSRVTILGRTFMFRLVRRNPTLEQISKHLWFTKIKTKQ